MAKLNPTQMKQLLAVGIKGVSTEEAAKTKLIAFLAENEVENVEDESLIDLINMADAFIAGETDSSEEEPEDETDVDALANEVDDTLPEEPEDEPEDVKPSQKPKSVVKNTPIKPAASAKPATKPAAAPAKKTGIATANGVLFDARNVEDHDAYLEIFREIFPADEYEMKILKQGFTIRLAGSNATPTIMNFDELRIVDGELKGNLYLNRLRTVDELDSYLPEELLEQTEVPAKSGKGVTYVDNFSRGMFRGETHPSIKGITQTQVFQILGLSKNPKTKDWEFTEEGALNELLARAAGTDKKMGENREKMEQKLEGAAAPAAKKK